VVRGWPWTSNSETGIGNWETVVRGSWLVVRELGIRNSELVGSRVPRDRHPQQPIAFGHETLDARREKCLMSNVYHRVSSLPSNAQIKGNRELGIGKPWFGVRGSWLMRQLKHPNTQTLNRFPIPNSQFPPKAARAPLPRFSNPPNHVTFYSKTSSPPARISEWRRNRGSWRLPFSVTDFTASPLPFFLMTSVLPPGSDNSTLG